MEQRLCLVVDDESLVEVIHLRPFAARGIPRRYEAEDGGEALNLVRLLGSKVSIVVSDPQEPMDGIALARSLERNFRNSLSSWSQVTRTTSQKPVRLG